MKVKFAIVGCGHIGKKHAELVARHPDAELVATIDPDYERFVILGANINHFQSLDDFFKQKMEVDVLNICTPNGLHAQQAIQCLNNDYNVVIEKPIALTIADANAILAAADRNNRYVFPVVQNRYSSTIKWLKQLVDSGTLGDIYMIQLNCFWNRDEHYYTQGNWRGTLLLDGGPLYTQFSHFIDVLNWIFGEVKNIESKFYNFNHQNNTEFEDSGLITFEAESGAVGTISYSTSVFQSNFESSITVIARNGTVKVGGQYMNCIEYSQINGIKRPILDESVLVNDYGSYKGSASNHEHVINNVINVLIGVEKPDVSLKDGVDVVKFISQVYKGRKIKKHIKKSNFLG